MNRLFLLFPLLAACVSPQEVATTPAPVYEGEAVHVTAVIAVHLQDPEIEEFRYWQAYDISRGQRIFCGEVNTESTLGAQARFKPFLARMKGKKAQEVLIGDSASKGCKAAAAGSNPLMSSV